MTSNVLKRAAEGLGSKQEDVGIVIAGGHEMLSGSNCETQVDRTWPWRVPLLKRSLKSRIIAIQERVFNHACQHHFILTRYLSM
jgi:hypothetical protein